MGTHKTVLIFKKKNKVGSGNNRLINLMLTHGKGILKWLNQAGGEHLENKAASANNPQWFDKTQGRPS